VVSDDGRTLRVLAGVTRTYELALGAARDETPLEAAAKDKIGAETVSLRRVINGRRFAAAAGPPRCLPLPDLRHRPVAPGQRGGA